MILAASKDALFYVGGAMEKEYPALCADLYAWIETGAPTLACQVLGMPWIEKACPGASPPFTAD